MARFRKKPMTIEALQWSGKNTPEVKAWMVSCLHRDGQPQSSVALFVKRRSSGMTSTLFSNVLDDPKPDVTAALWVQANDAYLGLVDGEWIAKDALGFYPIADGGEGAPMNYLSVEGPSADDWEAYAKAEAELAEFVKEGNS